MGSKAPHQKIDFEALAASLLQRVDSLLPAWLPAGVERNRRWYVGDFDGAAGSSANVNMKTGQWIDNGGSEGDRGGDLLSLYARIRGYTQLEAALELQRDMGWQAAPVQTSAPAAKKKAPTEWKPIHPVPDDAPEYRKQWAHFSRGVPGMHWEYRDIEGRLLGVTVRFETSTGGKDVQPLSYCEDNKGRREWRYKAFTEPRPMYGLQRLAGLTAEDGKRPLVIILEGEKKADKLYEALGNSIPVLGWPGGCKVAHLVDWEPLRHCRVVGWADADAHRDKKTEQLLPIEKQPGMMAMVTIRGLLDKLGVPMRLVDIGQPGERKDGWDAADAVEEGWNRESLLAFMRKLLPDPAASAATPSEPPGASAPSGPPGGPPDGPPDGPPWDEDPDWRDGYVWRRKGEPRECVANVMLVLHEHAQWHGVLAFDQFAQRVVKRMPAPFDDANMELPGEWTDVDDTRAAAWIARREGFVPNSGMVAEAANEVAHSNTFHPVLEWLATLQHDGTKRLDSWAIDLLGVKDTPYTRLVSRYFLIGMCKRVLEPGCKFDYCLVLEGPQGRKKSTALRILGGEWFSDIELDLQNKDSMSNIRGKWLHEFGEMGSLARSESNRQKSFLSRQIDEFRPVYGRREIKCKRQSVFAGSTNEWAWNKDPTGGRRFWPLEVADEINTDGLNEVRDQLMAEAFTAAKAGVQYWPSAEEQRELFDPEQLAREAPEAYVEMLSMWLASEVMALTPDKQFTLSDACMGGLHLDAKSMTKDVQTRVGIALRKLGCERIEHRNSIPRFTYKRPQRNAASSSGAAVEVTDEEVPF